MVVSGDVGLIGRRQASSAIAALGIDLPDMVGFWAQRTGHARPALAALAARLGTIGLLAFRGRHRRVRRRLGRDSEPGFERGHPGGQGGVLLAEHADLLGLRQHQRDQLGLVQSVLGNLERDPGRVLHTYAHMVTARMMAIAATIGSGSLEILPR